jgi:hypothetical protein
MARGSSLKSTILSGHGDSSRVDVGASFERLQLSRSRGRTIPGGLHLERPHHQSRDAFPASFEALA